MNLLEIGVEDVLKLPFWLLVAALLLVCILIAISYFTGRSVKFFGIEIGERKSEPSDPKATDKLKETYGIKIITPEPNSEHTNIVKVTGAFENAPPAGTVSAIVLNEVTNEYWSKNEIRFDNHTYTWNTEVSMGKETSGYRKILICAVGTHGKALIDFQKKVSTTKGQFVGISYNEIIREDIHVLAQLQVKMKAAQSAIP